MKKYVVSLLAFLMFLLLQTPLAGAGHSVRVGFTSRSVAVRAGPRHFVSPSVIVINQRPVRFVRVSPFAREVIILPRRHFVGNTVIIQEPFPPSVVVRSGPQVIFLED
jgi:hypothetical protein